MVKGLTGLAVIVGFHASALLFGQVSPGGDGGDQGGRPRQRTAGEPPAKPERLHVEGIENLFRLGPRLYSGGQPEGDGGFTALKSLGIKTIITVDGARPILILPDA